MTQATDKIEASAETVIAYTEFSDKKVKPLGGNKSNKISKLYFDGAEPWIDGATESLLKSERLFFADANIQDLSSSLDVTAFMPMKQDKQSEKENDQTLYHTIRARYASPSEYRGKLKYSHPLTHEISAMFFSMSGKVETIRDYYAPINGKWMCIAPSWTDDPKRLKYNAEAHNTLCMATAVHFTNRYQWFLYIKNRETQTSVKVPCSIESLQECYRLRDIVDGKKRRDALRNWVREHWRKTETKETKVRAHLRGAMKFSMGDWDLCILPSEYDRLINREPVKNAGIYKNFKLNMQVDDGLIA